MKMFNTTRAGMRGVRYQNVQVQALVHSSSYKAAYGLLASSSMSVFLSALYLMKSACGIDLMAGPSPFHHIFF